MSSAPSKTPPSADPAVDLDYSVDDFDFDIEHLPDSTFLFQRMEDLLVREGAVTGGRTLDVACGAGAIVSRIHEAGGEGWGIEASAEMLGISPFVVPSETVILTRGVAETLPFRDSAFDRVVCQGSLDHFVDPQAFMREAARVLRPDGRLIIGLANYESLSCRLGRSLQETWWRLRRRHPSGQPYWAIPEDHFHKGTLSFVRALGGSQLSLERCYGVSLLWLFPRWGQALALLPDAVATKLLEACDRIAHGRPALSDTIISVWRKREPA